MGNFYSSSSGGASKPEEPAATAIGPVVVQLHPPKEDHSYNPAPAADKEDNYDDDQPKRTKSCPSTGKTPYPGTFTPETMEPEEETHYLDQLKMLNPAEKEESGKKSSSSLVDPRVIHLLEFFRHMYARKEDLFGKVIPGRIREEMIELLTKMGKAKEGIRRRHPHHLQLMQRSFSIGASRGVDLGNDELKLERFKVKTLDVPSGGGTKPPLGGGTKSGGGFN